MELDIKEYYTLKIHFNDQISLYHYPIITGSLLLVLFKQQESTRTNLPVLFDVLQNVVTSLSAPLGWH